MSFRTVLSSLNSPPLVSVAGAAIVAGFPLVNVAAIPVATLQAVTAGAFAVNVTAVSIPGRMDGEQDARMRSGDWNPNIDELQQEANTNIVKASYDRTLVAPAGWAFAIWAPIYLGEAVYCAAAYYDPTIAATLTTLTAPFVAANLTQSLWCASFRPSYAQGWNKYVSVAMLGGTAVSLSQVPFTEVNSLYLIPLAMHFGWTTAATLVNFNGSLAMSDDISERTLIGVGHASSLIATALGVGVTLSYGLPAYGLTIAWALAACANGMRVKPDDDKASPTLKSGAKVQKMLLTAGSVVSAGASIYTMVM